MWNGCFTATLPIFWYDPQRKGALSERQCQKQQKEISHFIIHTTMPRILLLALLLIALFFGVYGTLRRVDWMDLFNVKQNVSKTEKKLGEMIWSVMRNSDQELKDKLVTKSLDSILVRLCEANDFDRKDIKLHILAKEEVNAFALPDGHMVVYSGLIANSESPEELAGVMAHELAHIQLDHVMKRILKEVSLTMLVAATTGSGGGELVKELARKLSSSAFDRKQEKEADLAAVDYMVEAAIDPVPFGEFLYRLGGKKGKAEEYLVWISTHPDSRERGEYIVEHANDRLDSPEPLLADETWAKMADRIKTD